MKRGRTTSQTKGKVYALNATVNVGYDNIVGHLEKPMRVSQLARVVSEALRRGRDR